MSIEVQIGIFAVFIICWVAGMVWRQIEAQRAYQRGKRS